VVTLSHPRSATAAVVEPGEISAVKPTGSGAGPTVRQPTPPARRGRVSRSWSSGVLGRSDRFCGRR